VSKAKAIQNRKTWEGWHWFNISSRMWLLPLGWRVEHPQLTSVRVWNAFRRVTTQGTSWGFGVLQIGRRHLLFVAGGDMRDCARGVYVLFLRVSK
jgi:hypothetical protein